MEILKAIEGPIELTESAVVFRGINRWDTTRTVPLESIASLEVYPGNFGTAARFTVTTSSGEVLSRRRGPRGRQEVPAFAAAVEAARARR